MLAEIHMIQNHAPSNLNRDDTGSPKEALFGGVPRARISSQCLKRSIRQSEIFTSKLEGHLGTRTRKLPGEIQEELKRQGCTEADAAVIAKKASAFGSDKESDNGLTRQLIFLGGDEVPALAQALWKHYKEDPKFGSTKAEELAERIGSHAPRSVDIALFGRMTTSALFEDVQASIQVAHAISTTKLDQQFDYYTAVDDLVQESDETGAGMIGDVEFNSATYYKYFCLHWEGFLENLGGDVETAAVALGALLRAAALANPTGKQNSFAAHNPPDAILVEVKDANVPVSYVNAFVKPVRATQESDVVEASISRLAEYIGQIRGVYQLPLRASLCCATRGQKMPDPTEVAPTLDMLITNTLAALGVPGGQR